MQGGGTESGHRNNARSSCIAPRAAGRRHGRYKWAGQPVVPSGHEEETHGPAGHIGLRVRGGCTRRLGKTGERRRNGQKRRPGRVGRGPGRERRGRRGPTKRGGDDRAPKRDREKRKVIVWAEEEGRNGWKNGRGGLWIGAQGGESAPR